MPQTYAFWRIPWRVLSSLPPSLVQEFSSCGFYDKLPVYWHLLSVACITITHARLILPLATKAPYGSEVLTPAQLPGPLQVEFKLYEHWIGYDGLGAGEGVQATGGVHSGGGEQGCDSSAGGDHLQASMPGGAVRIPPTGSTSSGVGDLAAAEAGNPERAVRPRHRLLLPAGYKAPPSPSNGKRGTYPMLLNAWFSERLDVYSRAVEEWVDNPAVCITVGTAGAVESNEQD